MFACSHCQFQNPTQNRFCQRCGRPLKGLQAIVACSTYPSFETVRPNTRTVAEGSLQTIEPSAAAPVSAPCKLVNLLTAGNYLDAKKRYQLRHPVDPDQSFSEEIELAIIDCQPAAEPPIQAIVESSEAVSDDRPESAEATLKDALPPQAYPYWKLQEQYFSVVPELQTAWQTASSTVVIIEDRTAWKRLPDVWDAAAAEPLEQLHWLYEMVELWDTLVLFKAEPSLLNSHNLLIDEDQILCFRRLLYRPSDRVYDFKDLGLLWQSLLRPTADTPHPLNTLAIAIAQGTIVDSQTVKARLADIADQLQEDLEVSPAADGSVTDASILDLNAEAMGSLADALMMDAPEDDTEPMVESAVEEDPLLADILAEDDNSPDSLEENIGDLPTRALPMKLHRLDEAGQTHVGRQRTHNEDHFSAETDLYRINSPSGSTLTAKGLYILCDGMGGHAGGEIASAIAVNILRDYFAVHWKQDLPDETTIKEGIFQANQAIYERNEAEDRTGNARMGTTLVMVLLAENQAVVAHVGDSRLYSYTRQGLKQVTVDHEVGQREIARGTDPAEAYARPDAYQLTQALGPRSCDSVSPSISSLYLNKDTLLLLCSDGLSDNNLLTTHTDTHIKPLLRSRTDLDEGVANLIDLANECNGHDNITAITIRIKMRPNFDAAKEESG